MAEKTKDATTNNAASKKRVTVFLPRNKGQNAEQHEFFSVNGRNYRIKRGEHVEIPEEVAEVITNALMSEEYAMRYVDDLTKSESVKRKEFGM